MSCLKFWAIAAVMLLSSSVLAGESPKFGDTVTLRLGGMIHRADATFSDTRIDRPPVKLDLNGLGMDKRYDSFWAGLEWQFAKRWGLALSYSDFSTDGERTVSEGGNFGDLEWRKDAELVSEMDMDIFIVDVTWDFVKTERSHFGLGVGAHVADFSMEIDLSVEGQIGDDTVVIAGGTETAGITAPLPNISMRGGHRFGDNFYLGGTAGYFSLKVGDVDGELITARGSLEWRPHKRFGLGIGYQFVSFDVKEKKETKQERYDADFYGPIFFVSAGF
ncbi:MAG: hypothetical protein GWM88_06590 [Pseudomonadales bacterium]|nr:hypothetical protein [Pseudomonadales bacterium]NIX07690.1 hypothetical protein [Pseudomonadales bacterium]